MSENKTAADAPQMASEMIEAQRSDGMLIMPAFDKGRIALINRWLKGIQAIAALPPAPLPADVAALIAEAADLVRAPTLLNHLTECMAVVRRLAALHKPAPMTEAEQAKGAMERG